MKYKLLVVTVVYKPNIVELNAYVDSFIKYNDLGEQAKLIVVDNSPEYVWDTANFINQYPMVAYIANPENPGFGAANNKGFELFDSDYVLFMNNDAEFTESVFVKLINIHETNDKIGCIGIHQIGGAPSYFKRFDVQKNINNQKYTEGYHFISGAFMFFKSSIFKECGMFDPCIFMYKEEYDILRRLMFKGYKMQYIPQLSFLHKVGNRKLVNEKLWEIGTHSYCYVCKKYAINPMKYYSNRRLKLLFIYQLFHTNISECLKIFRIIKMRNKILKQCMS